MRLTGGREAARLSAVRSPIMSVRLAFAVATPAASIAEAAAACATCWWHGRVHHDGH